MESKTSKKSRHKGAHFSLYESIPTHRHDVSIIFQEVIPKDKSFATHTASFSSNNVFDQMEMNLTNVTNYSVHNSPRMKNLLQFLHKCYGFGEMSKIQLLQEVFCISGVTLGKSMFLIFEMSK